MIPKLQQIASFRTVEKCGETFRIYFNGILGDVIVMECRELEVELMTKNQIVFEHCKDRGGRS